MKKEIKYWVELYGDDVVLHSKKPDDRGFNIEEFYTLKDAKEFISMEAEDRINQIKSEVSMMKKWNKKDLKNPLSITIGY